MGDPAEQGGLTRPGLDLSRVWLPREGDEATVGGWSPRGVLLVRDDGATARRSGSYPRGLFGRRVRVGAELVPR